MSATSSLTGSLEIDQIISSLTIPQLNRMISFIRDWNAASRTSFIAQILLHSILQLRSIEEIKAATNFKADKQNDKVPEAGEVEPLEALIPFTERNYDKVQRLLDNSYLLDYVSIETMLI
jgi:U3 small nucleolar RNA-associated protein 13